MAAGSYDFEDWERDFEILAVYVFPSESGRIPEDYLREIEAYFQKHHPEDSDFRFQRASSMLSFLVANISNFNVRGLAMVTADEVRISDSLRFALWVFFGSPQEDKSNPNPDPQEVAKIAEDADADGLFGK
jgi:hypothetical protein